MRQLLGCEPIAANMIAQNRMRSSSAPEDHFGANETVTKAQGPDPHRPGTAISRDEPQPQFAGESGMTWLSAATHDAKFRMGTSRTSTPAVGRVSPDRQAS
ncbi:MAG: hypothetical protein IPO58_25085 [Betaproteobacteria bacterium]|nr:hypothetical protein [Betaproteobacteria bacterium]